jgi:hypothetical protein
MGSKWVSSGKVDVDTGEILLSSAVPPPGKYDTGEPPSMPKTKTSELNRPNMSAPLLDAMVGSTKVSGRARWKSCALDS